MARARSRKGADDGRLLNFWAPPDSAGLAIGCVATTFTLDAGHFEEQCLARFISMETDPAESARAYLIEREEKMSQVFACVLVDQRHAKDLRSLRWHMLPVRLPGSAIQHAKISILMWERQLRIVIGSANLTPAGYRSNREVAAVLDFGPEEGYPLKLARDCIDYVTKLCPTCRRCRGHARPESGAKRFSGRCTAPHFRLGGIRSASRRSSVRTRLRHAGPIHVAGKRPRTGRRALAWPYAR